MKIKFLVLSFFILSSTSYSFSRGGDGGSSGGGLEISFKMPYFFNFNLPVEVHIYDIETRTEIVAVAIDELDREISYLEQGEYFLVYTDRKGNVTEQTSFLKE